MTYFRSVFTAILAFVSTANVAHGQTEKSKSLSPAALTIAKEMRERDKNTSSGKAYNGREYCSAILLASLTTLGKAKDQKTKRIHAAYSSVIRKLTNVQKTKTKGRVGECVNSTKQPAACAEAHKYLSTFYFATAMKFAIKKIRDNDHKALSQIRDQCLASFKSEWSTN